MSRWSCDKKSVYQSAEKISRKKFIETVQQNAHDTKKDKLLRLNKELSSIFHIDDNLTMSNKKLLKKIKNINIEILQILESTIPTEKN
ncbi:hypothetical protein OEK97_27955, partial [Escherichia coli]|uniref:hypothetical protein n=1 Tax=Escherichia coli TaxID=562 RepID=UPI0021DA9988